MNARPTGALARLVDAAFALALTAVVLVALDETFSDRTYLAVGMVAAAVATLIALALVDRGTAPFLLVALISYVLIGTMVTAADSSGIALPSTDRMIRFLSGAITGTTDLLTTIPPIDPVGDTLVIPFSLGFLVAAAGAWLALRTARPLLPVLPALLGIAAATLVAAADPTAAILRGSLLGLLGVTWAVLRSNRTTTAVPATRSGRWTRPVAAVVVVVLAAAIGTGMVDQRLAAEQTLSLRGKVGSGAEVDPFDNPLVRFRQYTRQDEPTVYGKPLLRVTGLPSGTAIRFAVLDRYDGEAWRAGNRTVEGTDDDLFQRIGSEIAVDRPGRAIKVDVDVSSFYASSWLPQSVGLTSVDFTFLDGRAQRADVRYNPATSAAVVVGGLSARDDYTYTATVPTDRLRPGMAPYPTSGPLQAAGAPADKLLKPWLRSDLPPMRKVFSLAKYLHDNGRYSDGRGDPTVPPGHDIERLTDGFFGARRIVGNDEQYAAFMALAANRLGVPARVVVGTVPTSEVVRGRNVDAWVELRVADGTWRRLPTSTFMSHRPAKPGQQVQHPPKQLDEDKSSDGTSSGQSSGQPPAGSQGTTSADTPGPAHRRWWLLVAPLLVLAVPGAKVVRRGWRRGVGDPARRVTGGWWELTDLAADQGRRLPVGLTRERQAEALGTSVGLAELANRLVFGPVDPTPADAADFWRQARSERRRVAGGVSILRRVLAWWSVRSFRR